MLTALHITLPKGNNQWGDSHQEQQQLSNRCLVVNDTTYEVMLTSTDASLKYANFTSHEMRDAGTRFHFDHITISPHHGSLFVKQVAPMLYDLWSSFTLHVTRNTATGTGSYSSHSSSIPTPTSLPSLNRSVFLHGSSTSTDRRGLFHHLAKATAHTLRRQTGSSPSSSSPTPSLSFALVDLYHAWGVGDVLNPDSTLHDRARLERLRREQPRRTVNKPKGMAFVEPTQYRLDGHERIDTCIARALQRVEPPRALCTDVEKEDHAAKSTLVLTFTITHYSSKGAGVINGTMMHPLGDERRSMQKEKSKKKHVPTVEARFHIILLPDSSAALHGKQGAQELSALATALGASVVWRSEGSNFAASTQSQVKLLETSLPSSGVPWAPLRESPLLLYLFESTMYYAHQTERQVRQLRFATERRRLYGDESRTVSANTSAYSNDGGKSLSTSTATSPGHNSWINTDLSASHILESISVGIGESLLVLCVNSAWDQYYQARSAFLFVQRATNQPGALTPVAGEKLREGHTISAVGRAVNNQASKTPSTTWIHSPYAQEKKQPDKERKDGTLPTFQEDIHRTEGEFLPSHRRRKRTEPRNSQNDEEEEEDENEQNPFTEEIPSDVSVNADDNDDDVDCNNGKGINSGDGVFLGLDIVKTDVRLPQELFLASSPCKTEAGNLRHCEAPMNDLVSMQGPLARASLHENVHGPPTQHTLLFDSQGKSICRSRDVVSSHEHPYAPRGNPAMHSPNRRHTQPTTPVSTSTSVSTTRVNRGCGHHKPCETIHAIQFTPTTTPACASSVSHSLCNKTMPVSAQEYCNDALLAAMQRQKALLSENERLRAVVAHLSSQQADTVYRQEQTTGIAEVHDAAVVRVREAARNAEIHTLMGDLAAATRKAGMLQRALARSVDENRKMRRVIHRQLQRCLSELPRVVRDTVAENKAAATPADAEGRISRVEKLLDTIATRVLRSVREEEQDDHDEFSADEDESNRMKEQYRETIAHSVGRGRADLCGQREKLSEHQRFHEGTQTLLSREEREQQSQFGSAGNIRRRTVEVISPINTSHTHGSRHVNPSPTRGTNDGKSVFYDDIEAQVVQLLRIAHKLFITDPDTSKDGIFEGDLYERLYQDKKHGIEREGFSLSQCVLNILSPDRKENKHLLNRQQQKKGHVNAEELLSNIEVTEKELCWKCQLKKYNQDSFAYAKFLELVRSLYPRIAVDESLFSRTQPQWKEHENVVESGKEGIMLEYTSERARPNTHISGGHVNVSLPHCENAVLMQTRQLSSFLQQHSDAREGEQRALQEARTELGRERQWRRQLQDELLQLRVRVSMYEAKLDLIDKTVKPKLSKDIVELQQMVSERIQKQNLVREQREAFVSQIQKRLEEVVDNVDLRPFPTSSSVS